MLEWLLYNTALPLLPVPLVALGLWAVSKNSGLVSICLHRLKVNSDSGEGEHRFRAKVNSESGGR